MDEEAVNFPQYEKPANPSGLQIIDRKQQAPLMKMIKMLTKPRTKLKTPKTKNWKKKQIFY